MKNSPENDSWKNYDKIKEEKRSINFNFSYENKERYLANVNQKSKV
jgi:hypothetical protein